VRVTLVFTTTTSPVSQAIRWVTGSRVSHVAIGLSWEDVPVIVEATTGGVKNSPRVLWAKDHILVAEYTFKPSVVVDLSEAIATIGAAYDYVGLAGYLVVLLGRRLGRKLKNPLASEKAMVCSEFVLCLNKEKTIPEWKDLDPEATTPEDLFRICEKAVVDNVVTSSFAVCLP